MDLNKFVGRKVVVQLSTPYTICGPDDGHEINIAAVDTPQGDKMPIGSITCLVGKIGRHEALGMYFLEYDLGPKIGWTKAPVRAYLNVQHVVAVSVFHDKPERPSNIIMPAS